jgi:uncharacterized protein (TIGR02118 family)
MAQLIAMFHPPVDPAAFDAYYVPKHIPLTKRVPGLKRLEISTGPVMTPTGPAPYHLVGVSTFDSLADLQAGLDSPEGKTTAEDLANFATGGVTILIWEHQEL